MVVNRTTLNMIKQRNESEDFVPGYNAEDPTVHVGSKNVRALTFVHSPQGSRMERRAEDGDQSPEGKSVTREHTRNSVEASPEGRSSNGRGSGMRLSTAP